MKEGREEVRKGGGKERSIGASQWQVVLRVGPGSGGGEAEQQVKQGLWSLEWGLRKDGSTSLAHACDWA